MKLKRNIFGILAIIFLTAFAGHAATITVNTLADENNTNAAACSLREAINNANGDNTTNGLGCVAGSGTDDIVINVNGTITPTTVLPSITSSLNITGNGASLLSVSGNNARRVFVISSGTVSINNLTATAGFNSEQAGGIYNDGGTVTLSGLVVSNSSSEQAGGIQNNGTMIVNNSTVTNNQATISLGGGIMNYGTLTINNSTISNNQGSAQGGGITNYASLTVNDSTFTNNSTPNLGGAIINNSSTFFSVTRSTFVGNTAGTGGAIYLTSPTASTVTNSTFSNNSANSGSAVSLESALTMRNCTVSGNRSENGAILINGGSGAATLINNIVAGNTNNTQTIQLDISTSAGGTVVTGSSFNNIVGTGGSGGLTNGVNGNQVGVSLASVRLLPLGSYGGLVQTMPIRPNSPARNAGTNTGAPATDARGFNRPQATTTDIGAFEIQTNSVVTNTANNGAGSLRQAVTDIASGDIIQFETPLFDTAQTISLSAGQITLNKNLTIYGNGANILNVQNTAAQSTTSRVFNISTSGFTINLNGVTVSGGNVSGDGGGIFNFGSTLSLTNCVIDGNTATGDGGGIRSSGNMTVLGSTISNNTATSAGGNKAGGIDFSGGSLVITNSTISGNSSLGGNTNAGGIWSNNNTTITNSTITNNIANGTNSGGGIYKTGGPAIIVRNSIIAANQNNATIPDVSGGFNSGGYNLIGNVGTAIGFNQPTDQTGSNPLFENSDGKSLAPTVIFDPMLAPLANNGGTVPTHAVMNGSRAIDKGNSFGSTTDSRGLLRPLDNPLIANAAGGDGADIGAFEAQAPTSASVSISGQVFTTDGRGLRNAFVTITDTQGNLMTARTSAFGFYRFDEIQVGETYVIEVRSKNFQFAPQIVSVSEELTGFNFYAIGSLMKEK